MRYIVTLLFFIIYQLGLAQFNSAIDSLNLLNTTSLTDADKATLFQKLGEEYFRNDNLNLSEKSFIKAKSLARKVNDLNQEIEITSAYINRFIHLSSASKGIETTLELKELAINQNNDSLLFKVYGLIVHQYTILGIKIEERKLAADSMLEIAKNLNDTNYLFLSYFDLGVSSSSQKAIHSYKTALLYSNSENNKSKISAVYNNLSAKYLQIGDLDSAIYCADKAFQIAEEIDKTEGMGAARLRAASALFFKKDFNASILKAKEGLNLFKKAGVLRRQDACAKVIFEAYKELGNYKESLKYFELMHLLKDSLNAITQLNEAKFVDKKFEYELIQKRDSMALLQEKNWSKLKLENINNALEKEKLQRYISYGGITMVLIFLVLLFVGFQRKKRDNIVIKQQKNLVEEKNQEILDSITYAKRIQSAILPPLKMVKEYLQESFILYKPKDIVAGDFYWLESVSSKRHSALDAESPNKNEIAGQASNDDIVLFAAADCTGHGVPGAMVSVVCNNGLNRSVREYGLTDPGEILNKTREIVIAEFEKSEEEVKDGMDIALCSLEGNTLKYAGANNPLWIIRKGEILETKANKQPIGYFDNPEPYTTHTIELQKGDSLYIFSDGYVDQFGGEKGKKFKAQAFRELLLTVQDKNMEQQKQIINDIFENWKGNLDQIDDVCVIGVRI
jgi:serine phosphatase RsbU (regulator of sigma subunit)